MNTQRTYSSAQKRFIRFSEDHGFLRANGSPCPTSELTILRFVGHLSETCKASSITVFLAAIRSLHIFHGFQDPLVGCLRILLVIRGLRRMNPVHENRKMPITPSVLCSIKAELDFSKYDDILLWAVCCTAFFGFFRASEYTASQETLAKGSVLSLQDVSIDKHDIPGCIFLNLRFSKTDQVGKGCTVVLARCDSFICPVAALLRYIWIRGSDPGPLFLCGDKSPLTRDKLNSRLQKVFKSCNIETKFTLHSFRVGAATTAASLGFPEYMVKALGRWSSDAYKVYVKLPLERLSAASLYLGQARQYSSQFNH